ncbi:nucleotidyltransferase family protein [Hyphomicrobium sp. LHD-15]|uniref:nucleotidyltransferase family protein n=1 Tax=Hyphomicrobium sp. LHD-15 TaxID=3072142 RepID=UPI00281037D4|nr:nucleotidyltransferase family protein [Hyphomicrobium sp. LHD-15]MDQ8699622.1 nucleotidyltransferase family protein [Hyphomicrobium sp. LHD-15]
MTSIPPAPADVSLSAVLLAGGASRRFGADNKLLAEIGGKPMLAKVADVLLRGGIRDVVVVTGAEQQAYAAALAGLPVRLVHNALWDDGMGGSVAAGVRALSATSRGAFVVPGDLANLSSDLLRRLAEAFAGAGGERVVVPVTVRGEQRNPVLWPRRLFPDLAALSGARGGKTLLDRLSSGERLDVAFEDVSLFADIDTRDDYARLIGEPEGDTG